MLTNLINQYFDLKKESIGELRRTKFYYHYTDLTIKRVYSDGSFDIIASWPNQYVAEQWLSSHINKFLDDKKPKVKFISQSEVISPLMENQNV